MAYRVHRDEYFVEELQNEIDEMQKKLAMIEKNTAKKEKLLANKRKILDEARATDHRMTKKLGVLEKTLQQQESQMATNSKSLVGMMAQVDKTVAKFERNFGRLGIQAEVISHNLSLIDIKEEDHYGDPETFEQNILMKIGDTKKDVARGKSLLQLKRQKLKEVKESVAKIDQPAITPEMKKAVSIECKGALKGRRILLLNLKMENHSKKVKLIQAGVPLPKY